MTAALFERRSNQVFEKQQKSVEIQKFCLFLSRLLGAVSVLIGLIVLTGWTFSIDVLKRGWLGAVEMNPLSAVSFVFAGFAVSIPEKRFRFVPMFLMAIGSLKIFSLLFGFPFLDVIMFRGTLGANYMAPNSAFCIAFLGVGLFFIRSSSKWQFRVGEGATLTTFVLALFALVGYLYQAHGFYTLGSFIAMALLTAITISVLAIGTLCLRPDAGLMGLLTSDGPGSTLFRESLVVALPLPIALGFLKLWGEHAGYFGTEIGSALLAVATVLLLVFYLVRAADQQNKNDHLYENESLILRTILDHMAEGVVVANSQGKYMVANSAAHELIGSILDMDPLNRRAGKFIFYPDQSTVYEPKDLPLSCALRGETVTEAEIFIRPPDRPDGVFISVSARPIWDQQGEIRGAVSSFRDNMARRNAEISLKEQNIGLERAVADRADELKRTQEHVIQLQKMDAIGRLAGGVAHDFNNMLAALEIHCELMMGQAEGSKDLIESIEEIKKISSRGAALTRQLLIFSRKQISEVRSVALNEVIKDMERLLRRLLTESIELEVDLKEDVGSFKADPGQIEQVILNLVVNARDAMPKGGKLTIQTERKILDKNFASTHLSITPGPHLMLSIVDSGSGMSKEVKDRLFEPFFTTKPVGKGTGLGLTTVYGIVKQFGGSIWVYSEEGKGTVFKVYFPETPHEIEDAPEIEKTVTESMRGVTVLLVDDDANLGKLFSKILTDRGFRVFLADSGDAALKLAEEKASQIELMVTDVIMPGMNGFDLAQKIQERWPKIKTIFMSGYTDQSHEALVESKVAKSNYLQKPFSSQALIERISEVLSLGPG